MSILIKGMEMPSGCYTCPIIYSEDGIVILVQGSSPHDVVGKAKLAIEKLSKEREENA